MTAKISTSHFAPQSFASERTAEAVKRTLALMTGAALRTRADCESFARHAGGAMTSIVPRGTHETVANPHGKWTQSNAAP
jgi:hypothetical protein